MPQRRHFVTINPHPGVRNVSIYCDMLAYELVIAATHVEDLC